MRRTLALLVVMTIVLVACTAEVAVEANPSATEPDGATESPRAAAPDPTTIVEQPEAAVPELDDSACGAAEVVEVVADPASVPELVPPTDEELESLFDQASRRDPPSNFPPELPVVMPSADDDGRSWALGPAWPIEIVSATPTEVGEGTCVLTLTLSPAGLELLNTLAPACAAMEPACPTGQVAIAARGQVLSAPWVASERFDSPDIVVSRGFEMRFDDIVELAEAVAEGVEIRIVWLPGPF